MGPVTRSVSSSWLTLVLVTTAGARVQDEEVGWPPLCYAAWKGDLDAARSALVTGAELEATYQEQTPLMWAAKMGHPELVAMLLEAGASVDATGGRENWTALRYGVLNSEIVGLLIGAGADPHIGEGSWYGTLAHLAARGRDPRVIELLHAARVPLDDDSEKLDCAPLHVAAFDGNGAVAAALLAHGVRVDPRGELGRTPMHLAAQAGHVDIVRELLARGADREIVDMLGRTAAHLACEEGHAGVLDVLRWDEKSGSNSPALARGDLHGWTPLHFAAAHGHARCIQVLRTGMSPVTQAITDGKRTALHLACRYQRADATEQLLSMGADAEARDAFGLRPVELLGRHPTARLSGLGIVETPVATALDPRELLAGKTGPPVIEARVTAGYAANPVSGLRLAVWSDGLVVFPFDPARPGEDLVVGRVPPETIARILAECVELALFDLGDWHQVGMHSGSLQVVLCHVGERRVLEWDGTYQDAWRYPQTSQRTYERAWELMLLAFDELRSADGVSMAELEVGNVRSVRDRRKIPR